MKCPNCDDQILRPVMTRQGSEVDYCPRCKGIWLDKGEFFHFVKYPRQVERKLVRGIKNARIGYKISPRADRPMQQFLYAGNYSIDYCPASGGLWFDDSELKSLVQHERNITLTLDSFEPPYPATVQRRKHSTPKTDPQRHTAIKTELLKLPNLFLRSILTLGGLYAILGLVLIGVVEFVGIPINIAVDTGASIILLQFLLGPFIMDITLRWLYKIDWQAPHQLPEHLNTFIDKICQQHQIKTPRIGIIEDGAPQAFTYGHIPGNARIVLSRGIFELLSNEEVEAVVAHEIGHTIHLDMFLMTIVQLVPLLSYYLYRRLINSRSSNSKSGGVQVTVALLAYVLYIISEYIVLWFSRTREYHADRFSGNATHDPSKLASALVKIAYGLAGQEKPEKMEDPESSRNTNLEAIGALGIFNAQAASAFAIASYSDDATRNNTVNKNSVMAAMRWDLWNPWAKWYQLNATHPLIANRLRYLSDQSVHMGKEPYIVFDNKQPDSYWDEFTVDLLIYFLPVFAIIIAPVYALTLAKGGFDVNPATTVGITLLLTGLALLLRLSFSYKEDFFPSTAVASLLKRVKVSAVRPVPCKLDGIIIGRGIPGYIFSEDFVLKDSTGIIFLDYRQPLALWEFLFGLLRAKNFQGQQVTVEGWYRRTPVPYIEVKTLTSNQHKTRSWVAFMYKFAAAALAVIGFGLILSQ